MEIKKLTTVKFKCKFLTTPRRIYLFKKLLEELEIIKSQCRKVKVIIFGSFITGKKEPNDIDVIISFIPRDEMILEMTVKGLEQKNEEEVEIHYQQSVYFLKKAEKLIATFNEIPINKRNGIKISQAIELLDL